MRTHSYPLSSGIRPTPEFEKKGLAEFAVNVGLKCAHDCTYCSTGAMLRTHKAFKELGENPFASSYSILDPDMPDKVAEDARRKQRRGMVQLCTTVDAWAPDAQQYDLGRRCLEAILVEPGWSIRILTKNATVTKDFDLIEKYRDRVLVGISLTGTADKDEIMSVVEPNASPLSDRFGALQQAHHMGLRTYGMLCPLLPGIADAPSQIDEMIDFVKGVGAEEVFAEAVNRRGNGLIKTQEALAGKGFDTEAEAIGRIRQQVYWSPYVVNLVKNVQRSMRKHMTIKRLRFLQYPSNLLAQDLAKIQKSDAGVVWL